MADRNPADIIERFEDIVLHDDTEVGQEFVANVNPAVREFMRKPHTEAERRRFLQNVKGLVETLDQDIGRKKSMKEELQDVRIQVMEELLETGHDQETLNPDLLRPVRARAVDKDGKDSGCYSTTSADMRLYTENEQLVTTPSSDAGTT